MNYLGLAYQWVDVDIMAGETRTTDFAVLNPNAKIPVLDLPGGQQYLGLPESRRRDYEAKQAGGHKALAVMEKHLETRAYFVSDTLTIADVSLYAYTHVAHEGGFDLSGYPAVRAWLNRIAEHPRHVPMSEVPAALAEQAGA
jgi:glutathione S-transferase